MTDFYAIETKAYISLNSSQPLDIKLIPTKESFNALIPLELSQALGKRYVYGYAILERGKPGDCIVYIKNVEIDDFERLTMQEGDYDFWDRLEDKLELNKALSRIHSMDSGMIPQRLRWDASWSPTPYAEILELGNCRWWQGRLRLDISCALLDTGEGDELDPQLDLLREAEPPKPPPPPHLSMPGRYWGEPEGMATWIMLVLRWLSNPDEFHTIARKSPSHSGAPFGSSLGRREPHVDIASELIKKLRPDDDKPKQELAANMLAKEMLDVLMGWNVGNDAAALCIERDGIRTLDTMFCELLRRQGKRGQDTSTQLAEHQATIREKHGDHWRGWSLWLSYDESAAYEWACWRLPFLKTLGDVLWHDVVCEQFERALHHRPALARGVAHDALLPMFARRVEVRGAQLIDRDGGAVVGVLAPSIDAALAEQLAQPGALDIFGHVYAHRLINHLARTVHEQKEAGAADFRAVIFEGGFSGLREAIGYNDSKNDELKQLLWAGQGVQFAHNALQGGGLWTWTNTKGPRGRLEIVAGAPLLPNFIEIYKGGDIDSRQARRLIPVLEHEPRLDLIPPRSRGPALTLVWLMLVELRDHAEELAAHKGIRTTAARWRELATRAGLPARLITDILNAWSAPGDGDDVQLIERTGAEWTLADPHALARDFIIEAGRRAAEGAENGRRAKRSKQSKGR